MTSLKRLQFIFTKSAIQSLLSFLGVSNFEAKSESSFTNCYKRLVTTDLIASCIHDTIRDDELVTARAISTSPNPPSDNPVKNIPLSYQGALAVYSAAEHESQSREPVFDFGDDDLYA